MALFKSLFDKKKNEAESDGQEEFFRDDFPPVVNPAKVEEKPVAAAKKEPNAPKKKAADPVRRSSESRRVVPQPVERIINPPKGSIHAKNAAKAKRAAEKSAEKPEKSVVTEKPAKKSAPKAEKAVAKKPEAKTEKSVTKVAKKSAPKSEKAVVKAAKPAAKAQAKAPAVKSKKATSKELYDDSPEVKEAVSVQESKATTNGKWEIKRAKDGRFFFSLYASNHTVIAYSQIYSSTTAVATGINSVIANAEKSEIEDTTLKKSVSLPCPKWEIYYDKAEQYRFRLYAPNGLCVCHSSHGYATKSGCKGGIESIRRFATETAKVDKSYLK